MFLTRSFNETQSAPGRRPAVSWSQSAPLLQGSPSAAQTTRERWEALTKIALPLLFSAIINVKETEPEIPSLSPARVNELFSLGLSPSAGDGVLLRVVRDGHVSGLHRGRAPGACDCSSAGCGGAAQGCAEDTAGCHTQQVGTLYFDEAFRIFTSHQVF